jgi:23S rRNA-/tRNA-specific pseudouridylate synthase
VTGSVSVSTATHVASRGSELHVNGDHPLTVLYRDAHFLVLDKPSGIATTAPDGGPSLFRSARELDASAPQLHPLSRLDTQVSGIVVFARTKEANERALLARRTGEFSRRYLGLTKAGTLIGEGEFRASIGLDPRDPKKRRALPEGDLSPGTKPALTRYVVRARAGEVLALDLYPHTGRTHQLRVHAAAAGSPLLGDVAYGGQKRLTLDNGRILSAGRVMLHCAHVSLPHPDKARDSLLLSLAPAADLLKLWLSAGGASEALSALLPAEGR